MKQARRDRGDDSHWMRRALTLARRRAGATWPNPTVGAIIVSEGRIVAEGAHAGPGYAHAEAAAIARLPEGRAPAAATIYTTLEPCHHQGRTPPCSRAIVNAGIERVAYAVSDTNPAVRGGGGRWLEEAGLQVRKGPLSAQAWELNHPFFETYGGAEPHVTLKLALSVDGRLARRSGPVADREERRITGAIAHRRVHALRSVASAIVVGRRTVSADRPRLTARPGRRSHAEHRQPTPVVLDSALRLPPELYPERSLVLTAAAARDRLPSRPDVEVVGAPATSDGLQWSAVLGALDDRRLGVVLVEGGARVAASLLAEAPPHRVHLYLAPKILSGDGPRFESREAIEERYTTYRTRRVGEDIEWILRRRDLPLPPDTPTDGKTHERP